MKISILNKLVCQIMLHARRKVYLYTQKSLQKNVPTSLSFSEVLRNDSRTN